MTVTLLVADVERAARLADAMNADPETSRDDHPWTVTDVIGVVLERGLTGMEQTYLTGGNVVHDCGEIGPTILGDPGCSFRSGHKSGHSWQEGLAP